ncbi:MAG: trigger factor [Oscillospiraceae bacterium]|nr:trigger factor [Oscillospiraceae bacterium]
MEITKVEKKEKSIAAVTVVVSPEEFDEAVNAVYKKNRGSIMVPGFRKGKAPRKIIEGMYGKGVFHEDAINEIAPQAYAQAIKEKELKVVASPALEAADVGEDGSLTLVIDAVLYPEITLKKYKGLEAVRKGAKVEDYQIDAEIERLRQRNASLVTTENEAKYGDTVVIDYEGFVDGVPFEGGKDVNHSLEIGSNSFIPGFEVQCIGAKAGSDIEVNVTFPEEYHAKELAGKPAVFKVHVHEVKEKILPELDDEFAKDVSEFDTLAEYKENIRKTLQENAENSSRDEFLDKILEQITAEMEGEIPDAYIDERTQEQIEQFAQRLQQQGISLDMYIKMFNIPQDEFVANMRKTAEKQLREELVLTKIADLENIQVAEDDKEAEYEKLAKQYGVETDSVKSFFDVDLFENSIRVMKAANFLVDNSVALPEPPAEEKTEEKPEDKAEEKTEEKAEDKAE